MPNEVAKWPVQSLGSFREKNPKATSELFVVEKPIVISVDPAVSISNQLSSAEENLALGASIDAVWLLTYRDPGWLKIEGSNTYTALVSFTVLPWS
jgi:hypothetical protein